MRNLVYSLLWRFSQFLFKVASQLRELSLRLGFTLETVKEEPSEDGDVESLFPHSFTTFKEGMASQDYCTRHDAASKLVGWYLHSDGHPLVEELVKAAEILLEDTPATPGDVSFLVGAWKDQASATTDADREKAEENEHKIYSDLAFKAAVTIKLNK